MHRKTKELLILLLFSVILRLIDPFNLVTKELNFRDEIFTVIIYAFPAAFLTILLSKFVYKYTGRK